MHQLVDRLITRLEHVRNLIGFGVAGMCLLGGGLAVLLTWPQPAASTGSPLQVPAAISREFADLNQALAAFEDRQSRAGRTIVSDQELQQRLIAIQLDTGSGHYIAARSHIRRLSADLITYNKELGLAAGQIEPGGVAVVAPTGQQFLPILLYHYPPADFEQQLDYLQQHGYTTVDFDQVAASLGGYGQLPAKPVVITFDDGFANQTIAVDALVRRHMKATFYIISSGAASQWCIGAGRRYNDPVQPPQGCGDAYLTWDQIRAIDRTGLITIGGHTVNHRNLASLSADEQRFEIAGGKAAIERELGHTIRAFCYPYGGYNDASIAIAKAAGYTTATTTLPGTYQDPQSPFTLKRIRDTFNLP